MNKYAPGPYHVGNLALVNLGVIEIGDKKHGRRQAILDSRDYTGRMEQFFANAQLFAAAPELLEGLENAIKWIKYLRGSNNFDDFVDKSKLNHLERIVQKAQSNWKIN